MSGLPDDWMSRDRPLLTKGAVDPQILDHLRALLDNGRSAVLATVIATSHSVPRRAGAKMLIADDGSQIGTVGGGEMEARVTDEAATCLANGQARLVEYRLVDPGVGDPGVCGGSVTIHLEPHMPQPTVLVIGCGHVGRAVVDLAQWLGYRVVATDDRLEVAAELADRLSTDSTSNAVRVHGGTLRDLLADLQLGPNDYAVAVTRNAQIDVANLPHLLATPVGSIGVMGSLRRWKTTQSALTTAGVEIGDLTRVTSPVGMEIGAETPEEIAVSILAQVVSHRRVP